jgi:hypothetical protein
MTGSKELGVNMNESNEDEERKILNAMVSGRIASRWLPYGFVRRVIFFY